MKKAIREVIVVEGRYDKNALSQVVDATIITLGGFAVFNDREKLAFLRRLAEQRGLIVLTDSDGAGFVIRNYLKGALPRDRVKQAYIPDIPGKERRKRTPGKEGKLGVEGMRPAVLLEALRRAGATFADEGAAECPGDPITKADSVRPGPHRRNRQRREAPGAAEAAGSAGAPDAQRHVRGVEPVIQPGGVPFPNGENSVKSGRKPGHRQGSTAFPQTAVLQFFCSCVTTDRRRKSRCGPSW